MLEDIKEKSKSIVSFLRDKSLKTRFVKLGMILFLIFLTFLNRGFGYSVLGVMAIFVAFEFSADSIFWVALMGITTTYTKLVCLNILIYELVAILLIRLVVDIANKRIDCKNWRFITLILLFVALSIYLLLPLSINYSITASVKRIAFFALMVLGVIRIKDINAKNFLILLTSSVIGICVLFMLARECGLNIYQYPAMYTNGVVERFGVIGFDPNFTGAVLICAITGWLVVYKKQAINKLTYFVVLSILMCFVLKTVSKATILIIALFGIYVAIENIIIAIKRKNPKQLLELIWYVIAVGIACAICWKYVSAMYERLFNPGKGWWSEEGGGVADITTGRTSLWQQYLTAVFSSLRNALFGVGTSATWAGFTGAAHSMPIEYLWRYGFVGVGLMLAIFVVATIPYIKSIKLFNVVPLVLITGIFCSIGANSNKYIYVFATIFIAFSYVDLKNKKVKVVEDINTSVSDK